MYLTGPVQNIKFGVNVNMTGVSGRVMAPPSVRLGYLREVIKWLVLVKTVAVTRGGAICKVVRGVAPNKALTDTQKYIEKKNGIGNK